MLFRIKIVFFFVFFFELIFWNHVEPVSCHMSRDRSNLLKLKQNWKYFIYKIFTCFSSLKFHSSNYNWCCCRCCRRCGERSRRRLLFFNFLLNQFIFSDQLVFLFYSIYTFQLFFELHTGLHTLPSSKFKRGHDLKIGHLIRLETHQYLFLFP